VNVNASDNVGVTRVDLWADGQLVASDAAAPYSFVWTPPMAGGATTLTAMAYDAAGNNATSTPVVVTVANATVTFRITKANGSVVSGNAVTGVDGKAMYQVRLNKRDPVGTYQGLATANLGMVSGSGSTSFNVQ